MLEIKILSILSTLIKQWTEWMANTIMNHNNKDLGAKGGQEATPNYPLRIVT